MKRYFGHLLLGFVLVAVLAGYPAQGATPDPFTILDKYIAANGGLDNMKAQKSMHMKGVLTIEGAGLSGTIEQWTQSPSKSRQELDLKVFKQIQGDNGEQAWTLDQNNKLQINRDSVTIQERRIRVAMADYEHLSRGSKTFTVSFDRIDTAAGFTCYVIKTTSNINANVYYDYYDTLSYHQIKNTVDRPKNVSHTFFSDYRTINGVQVPYKLREIEEPTNQTIVVAVDSIEVNQSLDSMLFEPPASQTRDFRFANGAGSIENVPFKYIENHLYIPLSINGKIKLWVLDSGAEMSVIEDSFARELGLDIQGSMKGQGVGATVDVGFTTLPAYTIGDLSFDAQKVAVIKLNWLFRKTTGMEIGGILGYDFLSRLVTRIDYANQTLSFWDPDSFRYAGTGVVINAPLSQDKMFHVPMTVDSVYGGLWNLDIGAGGMSFHYPYARDHDLLKLKGYTSIGFGAGGSVESKVSQFHAITFAGFTKAKPIVAIPVAVDKGAFASAEVTGNAGNTLFRHFVLYLDYAHQEVIVEKGNDFDKVFPEDRSGLQLALGDDGQIEALSVADGTPAAKAGFKTGDKIKTIGGKTPEALGGLLPVREMMKGAAGTKYAIEVVREGKTRKMDLTLKNLFD